MRSAPVRPAQRASQPAENGATCSQSEKHTPGAHRESSDAWYTISAEQSLAALGTTIERGLSTEEVRLRLTQVGPNVLDDIHRRSPVRMLLTQFTDVMVLVLIAAAVLAGFLGEPQDVAAIIAIVVLNAILGFVQEFRADRALAALKAIGAPSARVRREGQERSTPASQLVPGDLVLLDAGNVVPADLRLVEAVHLRIGEAALTGEAQPVEKGTRVLQQRNLPIGDHENMAYKGTVVTYGRGAGVVVATGMRTELGRIATLLRDEDEVQTPLQKRLGRFGGYMAVAVVALCSVIFTVGLLRGEPPTLMFMTALSLAVAAIPEALPAVVTVSLAFGARKMIRQHALIRRLHAVETLGSVTYICSDKTGTLTENRMKVDAVVFADTGPESSRTVDRAADWANLFVAMALNNDAQRGSDGELSGDPMETALHRRAAEAGLVKEELVPRWPRVAELPFSSERSRMTTVHREEGDGAYVVYTKGAPERVLSLCGDGNASTGVFDRTGALSEAERMAESGLRVLAYSGHRIPALPEHLEAVESGHHFLGLVGLLDPPREGVRDAVAACQTAGVRVVMITGDHSSTALAIARRLGIASANDRTVTGEELQRMSQTELELIVENARVYARVAPEDKIRVVKALQSRGEYVAVTGDGVNDAPALRRADIGVAMGRSGTDVAREAAHLVLLDDNFATIVKAVREGRRIYDNIRRFVRYSLSTNAGEIWTLFVAPFLGLPLPLLPIHILWMNLVTDGLPGLTLAAERPAREVMLRPPRDPSESIFANGLWQHVIWVGLLMAALALGTQAWALHIGDAHWQSMTFTVLTLSQLAHVLAIRSERDSLFTLGFGSNPPLLAAVVFTCGLQLATLYVPPLNRVFKTVPLTLPELGASIGVASIVFFAVELEKWMTRRGWIGRSLPSRLAVGQRQA